MPVRRIPPNLQGAHLRVGIVLSRFNPAIGEGLLAGAMRALRESAVPDDHVTLVSVPGALESPLTLQRLAQSGDYDALVALGAASAFEVAVAIVLLIPALAFIAWRGGRAYAGAILSSRRTPLRELVGLASLRGLSWR